MVTKTTAKRAITLAGGGPAAGLHVGALIAFDEAGIEFDVWSLSCIGAWVGIVYNTRLPPLAGQKSTRGRQTQEFFREHVFRDNGSHDWFPGHCAFAPAFYGPAAAS